MGDTTNNSSKVRLLAGILNELLSVGEIGVKKPDSRSRKVKRRESAQESGKI